MALKELPEGVPDPSEDGGLLTGGHKEDSGTQDDVVPVPVKLTGSHTEPPEEEQRHTEDGEDTGCPDGPCRTDGHGNSISQLQALLRLQAPMEDKLCLCISTKMKLTIQTRLPKT